jgi:hypothetical protein
MGSPSIKLDVDVIRSDNELGRRRTLRWLRTQGITLLSSATEKGMKET